MRSDAEPTSVQKAAEDVSVVGILVQRWFGAWTDIAVVAFLIVGPSLLINQAMGNTPESNVYAGNALVGGAILGLLYFPLLEGVWGRSAGKLIAGLVVVDKHARPPGLLRASVRTLLRLIEVNPVLAGGVPAGIVVLLTKRKRRLGDLAAGTYVLRAETVKYIKITDSTLAEARRET